MTIFFACTTLALALFCWLLFAMFNALGEELDRVEAARDYWEGCARRLGAPLHTEFYPPHEPYTYDLSARARLT